MMMGSNAFLPTVPVMTIVDLVIVLGTALVCALAYRHRLQIVLASAGYSTILILSGVLAIAAVYFADLYLMTIDPLLSGENLSMERMLSLHLTYSWYLHLVGFVLMSLGIGLLVRNFVRESAVLRTAREAAEAANMSKSQFLANICHELRTPLNSILGFSEIINNDRFRLGAHRKYRDYAGDINRSGSQLLEIVNDLLDISRVESGKLTLEITACDVGECIDHVTKLMVTEASAANVRQEVHIADDISAAFADSRALEQILINLISNAIKFSSNGGRVSISAENHDDMVCIRFEDRGIGIAAESIERILKPFERVDTAYARQYDGAGLGLAIVIGLLGQLDGTFSIDSVVGVGTTVTVLLPRANTAEIGITAAE